MKKATTQKVNATLRGKFERRQTVTETQGNVRYKKLTSGYTVHKITSGLISVDCCGCMDQIDAIYNELEAAGLELLDYRHKGLIGVVGQS